MIVEADALGAEPVVGEIARRIKGTRGVADLPGHGADELALRPAPDRKRPFRARGEIGRGIIDARQHDRLDAAGVQPGLDEALDRLGREVSAVALDARHPFLRDGGDELVIVIKRRPGVSKLVNP